MYLEREKATSEASHYRTLKEIDANTKRLTPEYLQKIAIESMASNTKLYFGTSIPAFIHENVDPLIKSIITRDEK